MKTRKTIIWFVPLLVVSGACSNAKPASDLGNEESMPGASIPGADTPGTTSADSQDGDEMERPRRAPVSVGTMEVDWNGEHQLTTWQANLDIREGVDGEEDSAEFAFGATDEKGGLAVSFSTQFPKASPQSFSLVNNYSLGAANRLNTLVIDEQGRSTLAESGEVSIDSHEAGKITGSFRVIISIEGSEREVTGQFSGKLGIACSALQDPEVGSAAGDVQGGGQMDGPGASWVGVGLSHPFCAKYL